MSDLNRLLILIGLEVFIVTIWAGWAHFYDRRKIKELNLTKEQTEILPSFWQYLGPVLTSTFFVGWYQILNGSVVKGIILFVLYLLANANSETITMWPGLILWFYATNDAIHLFRIRHMIIKMVRKGYHTQIEN